METVDQCAVCHSREIQALDPEFHLCRCGACGYVFDSPRPTSDEIVAFYSQTAKYDSWLHAEHARDKLWQRRLKKLLPHRKPGSILDVGAGIGQFLHHARPYFAEVCGTEVSASAVRAAKEKYGVDLLHGRVEQLDLPRQGFDNISLFHVLEHVPDPAKLVARCHELLRPQGTLVIAVPNDILAWTSTAKRVGRKLGLKAFQKFSPVTGISRAGDSREIHLSHFTPAVLRKLISDSGFEIVEQSLDPYWASTGIRGVAEAVYYSFHHAMFRALGANRYDTIWLVSHKEAAHKEAALKEAARKEGNGQLS